jgi:hypothetical protein
MRACFPFGKQNDQGPKNYAAKCGGKGPEEEKTRRKQKEKANLFPSALFKNPGDFVSGKRERIIRQIVAKNGE